MIHSNPSLLVIKLAQVRVHQITLTAPLTSLHIALLWDARVAAHGSGGRPPPGAPVELQREGAAGWEGGDDHGHVEFDEGPDAEGEEMP
jgi:hypothetical protein